MGLFERIFGRKAETAPANVKAQHTFQLLDGYVPAFHTWNGSVFESDLIRAALDAHGRHAAKLAPNIQGSAKESLQSRLMIQPNEFQTWSQFLYRLSTILDVHNTAFITPILDQYGEISGVYSPLPDKCELVQYGKKPYLRYHFSTGETAAIELENCGIMTKYQYRHDLMGENNHALFPTMELINIQNQGIEEAVKNTSTFRFMGTLANFAKPEDLAKERKRFTLENLSSDGGGLLLFPNTYSNIKQVDVKPWVIDAEQMKAIREELGEEDDEEEEEASEEKSEENK